MWKKYKEIYEKQIKSDMCKTASRKIIIVFLSLLWGEMIKLLGESLSYSPGCPNGEGVKQCVKRRWSEV